MGAEIMGAVAAGRPDPKVQALAQRLLALRDEIDAILTELAGTAGPQAAEPVEASAEPAPLAIDTDAFANPDEFELAALAHYSQPDEAQLCADSLADLEPEFARDAQAGSSEAANDQITPTDTDLAGELADMSVSAAVDTASDEDVLAIEHAGGAAEAVPAEGASLQEPAQEARSETDDRPSAIAPALPAEAPVIDLDAHRKAQAAAREAARPARKPARRHFAAKVAACILALLLGAALVIVQRTALPSAYALSWMPPLVDDATADAMDWPFLGQSQRQDESATHGGLFGLEGFTIFQTHREAAPTGS